MDLHRLLPGLKGYRDGESSRETDKQIRLRLATEISLARRNLEEEKKQLLERTDRSLVPVLDQMGRKLDQLAHTLRYASREYRGFFRVYTHNGHKMEKVCQFDLDLFQELEILKLRVKQVRDALNEMDLFNKSAEALLQTASRFERLFSQRQHLLLTSHLERRHTG